MKFQAITHCGFSEHSSYARGEFISYPVRAHLTIWPYRNKISNLWNKVLRLHAHNPNSMLAQYSCLGAVLSGIRACIFISPSGPLWYTDSHSGHLLFPFSLYLTAIMWPRHRAMRGCTTAAILSATNGHRHLTFSVPSLPPCVVIARHATSSRMPRMMDNG